MNEELNYDVIGQDYNGLYTLTAHEGYKMGEKQWVGTRRLYSEVQVTETELPKWEAVEIQV